MSTGLEGFSDWQRYQGADGPILADVVNQLVDGGADFGPYYVGNFEWFSGIVRPVGGLFVVNIVPTGPPPTSRVFGTQQWGLDSVIGNHWHFHVPIRAPYVRLNIDPLGVAGVRADVSLFATNRPTFTPVWPVNPVLALDPGHAIGAGLSYTIQPNHHHGGAAKITVASSSATVPSCRVIVQEYVPTSLGAGYADTFQWQPARQIDSTDVYLTGNAWNVMVTNLLAVGQTIDVAIVAKVTG